MASNYISLYGAVNKDGKPIDFTNTPLESDINTESLVWVKLGHCLNASGTLVPAFELFLNNYGGLTYSVVYLYLYPGFTTIQDFYNGLGVTGAAGQFTQYLNLVTIDYKAQTTTGLSVLVNTKYVVPGGRQYLPQQNITYVNLKWANNLLKQKWGFTGNQTFAGNYAYFY